jgi:hypothetical protein
MTPWISGCYHRVPLNAASASARAGQKVHIKLGRADSVTVMATDGEPMVLTDVTAMEGSLSVLRGDSVRLREPRFWHRDGKTSRGYPEAWTRITSESVVSSVRVEPVRSVLVGAVITTILLGLAALIAVGQSDSPGFSGLGARSP